MTASRRLEILVVEDNDDARDTLQLLLELEGHRVHVASSGARAVDVAAGSPIDVAVIDIGLPDVDGYAVARQIRAKRGDRIFLIALTGYSQPEDRRRATEAGFDAHLVKPVDPDRLLQTLPGRP